MKDQGANLQRIKNINMEYMKMVMCYTKTITK